MSTFSTETAVERIDERRWSAVVGDRWNIGDNPNGGYLVAIALRALRQMAAHEDPVSVTTHFLRPATAGERAEIDGEVVRAGRTLTFARATLSQSGTARLAVVAAFADLTMGSGRPSRSPGSTHDPSTNDPSPSITELMTNIPPPERCVERSGTEQGIALPILDRLDVRIHPDQVRAGQAGLAEVSGWIRLADGADPTADALVVFTDAFPPSLFGLLGVVGWVPTIELTVHVRRRPAPGWILGRFTTRDLHGDRMIEDGQLWDATGALVAHSRQLGLLLPRP